MWEVREKRNMYKVERAIIYGGGAGQPDASGDPDHP